MFFFFFFFWGGGGWGGKVNEGLLYACHFMNNVMQAFARVHQ